MTSLTMMKALVGKLNDPPFNSNLSLLDFDELNGISLLGVLKRVLAEIEPSLHDVNIRSEDEDTLHRRMVEFIHVLGYKADLTKEFRRRFMSGDKEVIHPILLWLFDELDLHKERAYLARYLVDIQIPPDLLKKDPYLVGSHEEHIKLQEVFKAAHASWTNAQYAYAEVTSIKQEISKLETERHLLQTKVQTLKDTPGVQVHLTHLLEATEDLWAAQEEDEVLATRSQQQAEQFSCLCEQHTLMKQQLQATQSLGKATEEGSQELVQQLVHVETRSKEIINQLKKELDAKKEKLCEVEEIIAAPPPAAAEINAIEQAISESQKRLLDTHSQQKKMEELISLRKRKGLLEENAKEAMLQQQAAALKLAVLESEFRSLRGYPFMNKQELKEEYLGTNAGSEVRVAKRVLLQYTEMLREKTGLYKYLKERSAQVTLECERKEKSLKAVTGETQALQDEIAERIRTRGVRGYEEKIKQGDGMKAQLAQSATVVEGLRSRLQRIRAEIEQVKRDKEKALQPLVRMHEEAQREEKRVTEEHGEKKRHYEAVMHDLEEPLREARGVVGSLQAELNSLLASYAKKQIELETTTELLRRAKEAPPRNTRTGDRGHDTPLAEQLEELTAKAEEEAKTLRAQHEQLIHSQDLRKQQLEGFVRLEALLKAKLEVAA